MKKILLIALLALTASCVSVKNFTNDTTPIVKNVELTTDKNFNYIRANEWMVETFVNAESVIQFSDKEAGIVKGKYLLYKGWSSGYYSVKSSNAIITVKVKDKSATIKIDATSAKFGYVDVYGTKYGLTKTDALTKIDNLINNFEFRMLEKDN